MVKVSKVSLSMRPNYENIKKLGKQDDYIFQALAHMGNASHLMSWANNCVEDVAQVPQELKAEVIKVNSEIQRLQDKLREIKNAKRLEERRLPGGIDYRGGMISSAAAEELEGTAQHPDHVCPRNTPGCGSGKAVCDYCQQYVPQQSKPTGTVTEFAAAATELAKEWERETELTRSCYREGLARTGIDGGTGDAMQPEPRDCLVCGNEFFRDSCTACGGSGKEPDEQAAKPGRHGHDPATGDSW